MRTVKDLQRIHASHDHHYGYVDITIFNCPPFVMFTNHNDCGICDHSIRGTEFEPGSTFLWTQFLHHATSAFDVGTRCGEFSFMAASLRPDIPIISCEANPDNFARLIVNMLANDVKNMHPKRVAVAHQDGFTKFGWQPKWLGHMSSGGRIVPENIEFTDNATLVVVQTAPLDSLANGIELGAHPLMKIDVEGAERMVFEGMKKILQSKPDIILECFVEKYCNIITGITQPLGYNYFRINEAERKIEQRDKLYPADPAVTHYYNQFLTARPVEEVMAIYNAKHGPY